MSIVNKILAYNYFRGDSFETIKRKISITIDSDILEALRIFAEDDDRSLSQYINIVLKAHIAEKASHSTH